MCQYSEYMGYIHKNHFSIEHRKKISEALKKKGIVPPSRKGVYKNDKPFDRKAYMKAYNSKKYAESRSVSRTSKGILAQERC